MDIASYYNKGWNSNWHNGEPKYCIKLRISNDTFFVDRDTTINGDCIYFKNKEDAQSVIDNPNFRDILDEIYKY